MAEMLGFLKETLIQFRKTIEMRTDTLLEMEKILFNRKSKIQEIDKKKQTGMNDEEKKKYIKDKHI